MADTKNELVVLNSNSSDDGILRGRSHRKNAFERLPEGANRERFIAQVKKNLQAMATADIDGATMVRRHPRTGALCLRIGFGGKNEYVQNTYHEKDDYLEYASVDEVQQALRVVLKMALEGEFDDALEAIRKRRQAIADRMVSAQKELNRGVFAASSAAA